MSDVRKQIVFVQVVQAICAEQFGKNSNQNCKCNVCTAPSRVVEVKLQMLGCDTDLAKNQKWGPRLRSRLFNNHLEPESRESINCQDTLPPSPVEDQTGCLGQTNMALSPVCIPCRNNSQQMGACFKADCCITTKAMCFFYQVLLGQNFVLGQIRVYARGMCPLQQLDCLGTH